MHDQALKSDGWVKADGVETKCDNWLSQQSLWYSAETWRSQNKCNKINLFSTHGYAIWMDMIISSCVTLYWCYIISRKCSKQTCSTRCAYEPAIITLFYNMHYI